MHETALVSGIMKIAFEQLENHRLNRLVAIKLKVGEFSGAFPDALRFAFEAMVAETEHSGARLEIEEIPGRGLCRFCQAEFSYTPGMECPRCGGLAPKLVQGEEMLLESIEAE